MTVTEKKKSDNALFKSGSFASCGKGTGWLILKKLLVTYSYQKYMLTNTAKISHAVSQKGMLDSAKYTYTLEEKIPNAL